MAKETTKTEQQPANEEHAGITTAYLQEKGQESATRRKNQESDVEVSLLDTHKVKFTKDFGFMKKDRVETISQMAFEIYTKAGVIEKI